MEVGPVMALKGFVQGVICVWQGFVICGKEMNNTRSCGFVCPIADTWSMGWRAASSCREVLFDSVCGPDSVPYLFFSLLQLPHGK